MSTLATELERHGLTLSMLGREAEAVILFGSRAAGLAGTDSDWDILVVGRGRSRLRRGLDLLYVDRNSFDGASWRTSELAGHIGRWGVTLWGASSWLAALERTETGEEALALKRRQLRAQLGACERYWPSLPTWACATRRRRLRRDLQRHARLLDRLPIPPSALLDEEWEQLSVVEQSDALKHWRETADLVLTGPWFEPARTSDSGDGVVPAA